MVKERPGGNLGKACANTLISEKGFTGGQIASMCRALRGRLAPARYLTGHWGRVHLGPSAGCRVRCSTSPAGVAQLAEQPSCKRQVTSSILVTGSTLAE